MKPTEFTIETNLEIEQDLGKPRFFNPEDYLDVVEQMVAADEIIFALKMLDNMPGYYRMHPYPRAVQLKKDLYKHISNVSAYSDDEYETYENSLRHQSKLNPDFDWANKGLAAMIDIPFVYPRAPLALQEIKKLNELGKIPHIFEMGSANFYLPYGLLDKGCKFTYYADTLNKKALIDHKERLKHIWKEKPDHEQPQVFICFETIEHLWDEKDILHQYHKYGADADVIMMSTPCCTLLGGVPDYKRELGHLRTFTPNELIEIAQRFWPGYEWSFCLNHMMVAVGTKTKGETK